MEPGSIPSASPVAGTALTPYQTPGGQPLIHERDALRIQAAAVVAQQASLTELEIKLKEREAALQLQERQLADHLEARRSQLKVLQDQISSARADLRRQREELDAQTKTLFDQVESQRKEATSSQQQAERERARFIELRRRLKRRWRRHWSAQEAEMRRRERALEGEWRRLADEADRIQADREQQIESRLQLNTEIEFGRRQLQDAQAQFAREQLAWQEQRSQEQARLQRQARKLQKQENLLAEIERDLLDEKQQWQGARVHLEQELAGLDARIRNQRQLLIEQQERLPANPSGTATSSQELVPAPTADSPILALAGIHATDLEQFKLLERLASDLADQRVNLAEQFIQLVRIEERWQQDRLTAVSDLAALALQLQERARNIEREERGLAAREEILRQQREDLAQARSQLDAWHARLAAREAAWQNERATILSQAQASQELAKRQIAALDDLRRQWKQKRREEALEFQKIHTQFVEARRMYSTLWEECLRRSAALDQGQRTLAEKTLALEQYRLEVVGQAEDAALAERQIERLRRRWAALFTQAERRLAQEQDVLESEIGRVNTRCREVELQAAELAELQAKEGDRQTESEYHQFLIEETNLRLRQELNGLRRQREEQERQILALRDEVERMAHTLLDQTDVSPLPHNRAA